MIVVVFVVVVVVVVVAVAVVVVAVSLFPNFQKRTFISCPGEHFR